MFLISRARIRLQVPLSRKWHFRTYPFQLGFFIFFSSFTRFVIPFRRKKSPLLSTAGMEPGVHIYSVYVSGAVSAIRLRNWQQQDQKVRRLIGAVVTWRFCVVLDLGNVPGGRGPFHPPYELEERCIIQAESGRGGAKTAVPKQFSTRLTSEPGKF